MEKKTGCCLRIQKKKQKTSFVVIIVKNIYCCHIISIRKGKLLREGIRANHFKYTRTTVVSSITGSSLFQRRVDSSTSFKIASRGFFDIFLQAATMSMTS